MAATTETLDARRRWRMRRPPESAAIPATSPEARVTTDRDRCNLTNGQLAMWMGQHLAPELSCFDNPLSFVIRGELDVERFAAAFQALVDRSDAMRTVIEEVGRVPVQRVLPQLRYDLPIVRLGGSPDPHRALADWAADRAARPSNLEERPFDSALVELGPTETAWYLNLHHAVFDGLSCALIYERLSELYVHALAGTLDEAPDMPAYADYVAQERASRRTQKWRDAEQHWREVFERGHEPVEFYGVGPASRTHEERWERVELGAERTAALREWATSKDFRSFNADMSLLGIFSTIVFTYLHRVSGAPSLSFGVPFHNRGRTTRDTIGMVQQIYPLQVEIDDGETLASLMGKTMRALWAIRAHAPDGSGNAGDPAVNDVLVNYFPAAFAPFGGLPTRSSFVPKPAADGARSLLVQIHDLDGTGSMTVDLAFNAGVFDEEQRRTAMSHFLNVVDQFILDPSAALDAVSLLSPDERARVAALSGTDRSWPSDYTIDRVVAEQVARTPSDLAVIWGTQSFTYAELDARANQVARHLQSLGVGPGVVVGVYAERSLDLMAVVLGIFKAGGVYLPLDVTYPAERIEFILRDSKASVVVTETGMCVDASRWGAVVLLLDDLDTLVAGHPITTPTNAATAEDLAYVIYTSGSTGQPKGAAVPQRALVNVVWWQMHHATTLRRQRTLQFAPLSFDVSMQETFSNWGVGGTLVLPTGDVRRDPDALLKLLIDQQVEQLFTIFTPLQQMAEACARLDVWPEGLKEVISCGERLVITSALERFFERLPGCRLQNQYGSSEDLIITSYDLTGPPSTWPRLPSIGRPIDNARVYLLDSHLQPVPVGVPGEICVGGAQVALGYLHRPELTTDRFVPCPFADDPAALMFRQGDLARFQRDGNIQFLGRNDNQIKLRGFRIEPGEVEAALSAHDLVAEAVVVVHEDDSGKRRLIAYVVAPPDPPDALVPELREMLTRQLPPYMVPAVFIPIEAMPRTPSGKIDRRGLPTPEADRPSLVTSYVAPRGELEQSIAAIWRPGLGVDKIGRDDDFFQMGGDSLLAVRMMHETEDLLGQRLPLVTLFEAPTVAKLAALLGDSEWSPRRGAMVPVRGTGSKVPMFFVSVQSARELASHLDPERPFYALHPRGLAGYEPDTRVEEMAASYIDEVRQVQPHGPYVLGGNCLGGLVAFEMARQLAAEGEEVAKTVIVECYAPGLRGFKPRTLDGRLRRRVKLTLAYMEESRVGALLVSLWSTLHYRDRVRAKPMLDESSLRTIKRVQRSNLRALLAYAPPTYPGAVTVFRGDRDHEDVPNLGWDSYALGGVEIHDTHGAHDSVLYEPQVEGLAQKVEACLESAGL